MPGKNHTFMHGMLLRLPIELESTLALLLGKSKNVPGIIGT